LSTILIYVFCETEDNLNHTYNTMYHHTYFRFIDVLIPVKDEFKNYVLDCTMAKLLDIFHIRTTRVLDHSDCSAPSWLDFDPIALLQALVNAVRIIHA